MAQIYEEQVRVNRDPIAPDTSIMQHAENQRQGFMDGFDYTAKVEIDRQAKETERIKDLTLMAAQQVYRNAETLHPNDVEKYEKVVKEGLGPIFSAVPNSPEKANIMAQVEIFGSGYTAKVKKGQIDKNEKMWITSRRELLDTRARDALNVISANFVSPIDMDNFKYTPEELIQRQTAIQDQEIALEQMYNNRNLADQNGNPVYTDTQRNLIKDQWENLGYYKLMGYAQENVQNDYNGVMRTMDWVKSNKEAIQAMPGMRMDDDAYERLVKTMDKVTDGQLTPQQAMENHTAMISDKSVYEAFDFQPDPKTGELLIKNKKMNNLNSLSNAFVQMNNNYTAYTGPDKEKHYEQLAYVSQAMLDLVEKGNGVKGLNVFNKDKRIQGKFFDNGQLNNGEVLLQKSEAMADDIIKIMGYTDPKQIKIMKAKFVVSGMKNMTQGNIDMKGLSDPRMDEIMLGSFATEIQSITGRKIQKVDGQDPYETLKIQLATYKQNKSQAYVQTEVDKLLENK